MTETPPWAPSSGTASFTPPSIAPASPSELRLAEGVRKTKSPKKPSKLGTVLLSMLVIVLVVAAGVLIWNAFIPGNVEAPLPAVEFEKPAGGLEKAVGPTGEFPVELDSGESMSLNDMAPNTMFIPALGVYMPVEADSTFVSSQYEDFQTLRVPSDPSHGVWYAGGAPLYGDQTGVTMIASHVSSSTAWGALRYLYTLTGGELIYTKDAAGQLQSWQMTKMRVEDHTSFPQEYWSPEGERQLVVTTCGGSVTADHLFKQNIFAIAVPVDPKPKTSEQLEAESLIASMGALVVQQNAEESSETDGGENK